MALLLADKPDNPAPPAESSGHEELAPVTLSLAAAPAAFDRVAEYADTVGGFAAHVGGQMLLTVFLAATDETSYMAAAQQAALDAINAELTVSSFDYDLVNISDIADRTNRSRQAIRQYVDGSRGPGGFPFRFGHAGQSDIWDWGTVNTWFRNYDGSGDPCYLPPRIVLMRLNSWLHQHNTPRSSTKAEER